MMAASLSLAVRKVLQECKHTSTEEDLGQTHLILVVPSSLASSQALSSRLLSAMFGFPVSIRLDLTNM